MMKEQVISFKTAKLAKEKGFNEKLAMESEEYTEDGSKYWCLAIPIAKESQEKFKAPTQSFLQKWLREIHSIDIQVNPMIITHLEKKAYFVVLFDENCEEIGDWQTLHGKILDKSFQDVEGNYVDDEKFAKYVFEDGFAHETYEEALEEGLYEGLKQI